MIYGMEGEIKKENDQIDIKYTKALKFIWEEQKIMLKNENLTFDFFVDKKKNNNIICETEKENSIKTSFIKEQKFKYYYDNLKDIEENFKKQKNIKKNFEINWAKVENYREQLKSEEVK